MSNHPRRIGLLALAVLFSLTFATSAWAAKSAPDHTQAGSDITVAPDEQTGELTCFGCSVRVRGHVMGDVTTFGGSVNLEEGGQIDGEVTTFAGGVRMEKGVQVKGDVTVFGGRIRRDATATIEGEVTNFGGGAWVVFIFALPLIFLGLFVAFVVWLIRKLTQPRVPAAA